MEELARKFEKLFCSKEQQIKSGAEAQNLATCKFFKQLVFIHDKVMNKKTHSNFVVSASNMEREDNAPFNSSLASPLHRVYHLHKTEVYHLQSTNKQNNFKLHQGNPVNRRLQQLILKGSIKRKLVLSLTVFCSIH